MRDDNCRGKRAQTTIIDEFMIANQDLLVLNKEEIEEILEPILKNITIKPKDEFCTTNKKEE